MTTRRRHAGESSDELRPADGTASERLREVEGTKVVSRRGVLWRTGLATVGGAVALTALDERRADAATGGNFLIGESNSSSSTTELSGTASPVMQLNGGSLGATGTTLVISGPSGGAGLFISGSSTNTTTGLAINGSGTGTASGIFGSSGSGTGVIGSSTSGVGVSGASSSNTGVKGASTSGTGMAGSSSSGTGVVGTSTTSGTGMAGSSSSGTGVVGTSTTGAGMAGSSTSGTGVIGTSTTGAGMAGASHAGTGVSASSTLGNALSVNGKAHFSRSGSASVPTHHTTKTVAVSGITSSSLVLVTLQSAISGVYVQSAVPSSGKFTVHLSKKAPHAAKFAWFILN